MDPQAMPHPEQVVSLLSEAVGQDIAIRAEGGNRVWVTLPSGEENDLRIRPWSSGDRSSRTGRTLWLLRGAGRQTLDVLRRRDESFVDLAGVVRLRVPGLLVDREDLRVRKRAPSIGESRSPFADRSSLVPRTLFAHGEDPEWTISSLARAAGVATSTASYAVRALAERELVEVHREWRTKIIRLTDRRALVEEWASEYGWRSNVRVPVQAPVGSPSRFLRRLPRLMSGVRWALTLHAGASLVAPHATWDTVHLYLDIASAREALDFGAELGWPAGEKGPVVFMVPHYRSSAWFALRELGGLPVVSDLQLILDLWHYPLRGREQSEHLFELLKRG